MKGNFCDKQGKAVKPAIIQGYIRHMAYVKKSHCMTKFFLLGDRLGNREKKLFFHLLDLTILNSFIILDSCGSRL